MIVTDPNVQDEINVRNFPDLRRLRPRIMEILDFVDEIILAVDNYQKQKIAYVDVLVSDIEQYQLKVRALNDEIRQLRRVPFALLLELRIIDTQLGLFKNQPEKFREYYIRSVKYVDNNSGGGDFK